MNEEPRFHLRLFGGPILTHQGDEVPLSPMQLALLAAVYGHDDEKVSRSKLAWLLWEADDDAKARHRISQLLYGIRQSVDICSPIQADADFILGSPDITSELHMLRTSLSSRNYEEVVRLLKARFLPFRHTSPTDAYCDWRRLRRIAIRKEVREAVAHRWTMAETTGDWSEAKRAAEALLLLHPDNEQFLRAVVKARLLNGAPEEAQAAIQTFRDAVADREWHPEDATRLLAHCSAEAADAMKQHARGPFLGRTSELNEVRNTIEDRTNDCLVLSLLSGGAGVGKTRFLKEASIVLRACGISPYAAQCSEFEHNIPLAPFIEVLSQPSLLKTIHGLDEPWRSVMTFLLPNPKPPDTVEPVLSHSDNLPFRLLEAIRVLMLERARHGPIALLIDDVHWMDDTSLSALSYLMRRWGDERLVIILSFRPDLQHSFHRASRFISDARQSSHLSLHLDSLTQEDTEALVRSLVSADTPTAICERIVSLSGRNPFFATELAIEYARRATKGMSDREVSLPSSVRELLLTRTRGLSPVAREVLDLIAVVETGISREDIGILLNLPMDAVIAAVRELSTAELVLPAGAVRVKHELIQRAVSSATDPDRRRDLHAKYGNLVLASRPEEGSGEAALHFHRAGNRREAFKLSRRASKSAEEKGAISEAINFCEIAHATASQSTDRARLCYRLAKLHRQAYDLDSVVRRASEAEEGLRAIGDSKAAADCAVMRIDAQSESRTVGYRTCIEALDQLIGEFERAGDWASYADAQEKKARLCERLDDRNGVLDVLNELRNNLPHMAGPALAIGLSLIALDLMFGDGKHAVENAVHASIVAEALARPDLIARTSFRSLFIMMFAGLLNMPDGIALRARCQELSVQSGDFKFKYNAVASEACWQLDIGELEAAEAAFRRAQSLLATPSTGSEHISLPHNIGEIRVAQGDWAGGRTSFKQAIDTASFGDRIAVEDTIYAGLGLCELKLGNLSAAREMEERVRVWDRHWYSDPTLIALFRAELRRLTGDLSEAAEIIGQTASDISSRWPAISIKLQLAELRYRRRIDRSACSTIAETVRDKAIALRLERRQREAERWLDGNP